MPTLTVSDVVCGANAKGWVLGFGVLILAFFLLVLVPTFYLSLKIMREARQHGGCAECMHRGPPMRGVSVNVPVQTRLHVPMRVQTAHGQRVPAGSSSNVPVAQAVPVTVPVDVKVAPQPRSMV